MSKKCFDVSSFFSFQRWYTHTFKYNCAACVSIHTAPCSRIEIPYGWGRVVWYQWWGKKLRWICSISKPTHKKDTGKRRWQQNLGLERDNERRREDGALIPLRKEKKRQHRNLGSPSRPMFLGGGFPLTMSHLKVVGSEGPGFTISNATDLFSATSPGVTPHWI